MPNAGTIVLLDDERELLWSLERFLKKRGFYVRPFDDGEEALRYLQSNNPVDVAVSDIRMPSMGGLEFLTRLRELPAAPPVIMMTAYGTIKNAVEAMKAGAYDYLTKPFEVEELVLVIQRAMELVSLRKEVAQLRQEMKRRFSISGVASKSKIMQTILSTISRMASEKTPVLFVGDSGTGKQFFSQVIHKSGDYASRPFELISCSAIPPKEQKLQIFGGENYAGAFQRADTGLLFLDDLDALTPECQMLLLQYLEQGKLAGHKNAVEVRIIASVMGTDEEKIKQERKIHPDLFFQLSAYMIQLPQLRNRREDIALLAENFLETFCEENDIPRKIISQETMKVLLNYAWPGNVRELQNVIERAVILSNDETIGVDELPLQMTKLSQIGPAQLPSNFTLEELEKAYIYQVLQENNNHQGKTAKALGIDRKTLWRKVRNYYPENADK